MLRATRKAPNGQLKQRQLMREKIRKSLNEALKARDKRRAATLRLISAAIKDRDIEARGTGKEEIGEDDILALLQKMARQREESAVVYEDNGRPELAAQEREEIEVIEEFLPRPMSEADVDAAIDEAISETGAESVKDMGRVIGVLKANYPGRIDFGQASGRVKKKLAE